MQGAFERFNWVVNCTLMMVSNWCWHSEGEGERLEQGSGLHRINVDISVQVVIVMTSSRIAKRALIPGHYVGTPVLTSLITARRLFLRSSTPAPLLLDWCISKQRAATSKYRLYKIFHVLQVVDSCRRKLVGQGSTLGALVPLFSKACSYRHHSTANCTGQSLVDQIITQLLSTDRSLSPLQPSFLSTSPSQSDPSKILNRNSAPHSSPSKPRSQLN